MDEEASVDVDFISEADEKQTDLLDKVVGRKIWNVELLQGEDQAMIKMMFSEDEDDYLLIHCAGADIYLGEPKPKSVH